MEHMGTGNFGQILPRSNLPIIWGIATTAIQTAGCEFSPNGGNLYQGIPLQNAPVNQEKPEKIMGKKKSRVDTYDRRYMGMELYCEFRGILNKNSKVPIASMGRKRI